MANKNGNTALHYVVWCSKDTGQTELHNASFLGDMTTVMRLLRLNDHHSINAQNTAGYTPLHFACYFGHSEIVKVLMLAGADKTICDGNTQIPIQMAERRGHTHLVKWLNDFDEQKTIPTKKFNKLSSGFLITLVLKLMRQKIARKRWFRIVTVVFILLAIKNKCDNIKDRLLKVCHNKETIEINEPTDKTNHIKQMCTKFYHCFGDDMAIYVTDYDKVMRKMNSL